MQTYLDFPSPPLERSAYLTIGNFDGVHRGHQQLVSEMVAAAHVAGCLAGLLTFDPHPLAVLRPDVPLAFLTSPEERAELLAALGLDFVLILPFNRSIAALPADEFMRRLVGRIPLCALWIGPDFALGRGREGNAVRLAEIGRELGYQVMVTPDYDWQGEPVRSSRIRGLLAQDGAVDLAADLLGHPYQTWGEVATGAQRGRRLGFPTANVMPPAGRLLPAFGVYVCWAWRENRGYPAVVNVGIRPSFDNGQPTIEAYLLDFAGDLYGETLGLSFIARLRGEMKFADISALIAQIHADAEAARLLLAAPPDHAGSWKLEAGSWTLEAGASFWTELSHTADWAVRVIGDSQRQLFARTAAAMYLLQGADPSRPITLARAVQVEASNPPELLVAWLNRLLLGQELDEAMYTRFEIHELSATGLAGVAYGYSGAPAHTGIKAVTYYDLSVEETGAGWEATVTFDV
ncbi:MAG: riboflavin biosynthesis protein RibF [Chloroflexi bacterium]|nr:riboflavin biosynthesis protein RibF [Chloroflexota bacterium]